MGPTNIALVKLAQADQKLREAQGRLDAAGKNVRIQERRATDLTEKLNLAHTELRTQQAKAAEFELDIKTRDARIERLRTQQQAAKNNKEYQAFLIEISTEKVDRGKTEDELIKVMEIVEKAQAENAALAASLATEAAKLNELKAQSGETLGRLKAEVDALRPAREAAAAVLPARVRDTFERLAERFEGEALAPLLKPDRRREEYACGSCNMDLVTDVYNKLHSRDDLVYCPSCGRMLFIPEELPPEAAINSRGKADKEAASESKARTSRTKNVEKLDASERRAKGKIGELLAAAQGESVKTAVDAEMPAVECDVFLDGKFMGVYKGRTREHLERVIQVRMEESKAAGNLEVRDKTAHAPADRSMPTTAQGHGSPSEQAAPAEHAAASEPAAPTEHATPTQEPVPTSQGH